MILETWEKMRRLPFSGWLFQKFIGKMIPYTGTISPRVLELKPGFARVQMKDTKAVRNHLNSVHAIALANLGEFTSGVALVSGLGRDERAIPTKIEIEYLKKSRGTLTAECQVPPRTSSKEAQDFWVEADIMNAGGEVVAKFRALWRIGLK